MENLYEKALTLFDNIDKKLENHYQGKKRKPPCAKGCASCCSQFFEISELEFSIIYEGIKHLDDNKLSDLSSRSKILYGSFKEHWPQFYADYFNEDNIKRNDDEYYSLTDRFEVAMPCVFLSNEGSCDIYLNRPFICRTTGVGFTHLINRGAVCDYIKKGLLTPLWQADLRSFVTDIEDIRWIESDSNSIGYKRQYPMFYYVYDLFHGKGEKYYADILETYKKGTVPK